jgi:hypothetical protein
VRLSPIGDAEMLDADRQRLAADRATAAMRERCRGCLIAEQANKDTVLVDHGEISSFIPLFQVGRIRTTQR